LPFKLNAIFQLKLDSGTMETVRGCIAVSIRNLISRLLYQFSLFLWLSTSSALAASNHPLQ